MVGQPGRLARQARHCRPCGMQQATTVVNSPLQAQRLHTTVGMQQSPTPTTLRRGRAKRFQACMARKPKTGSSGTSPATSPKTGSSDHSRKAAELGMAMPQAAAWTCRSKQCMAGGWVLCMSLEKSDTTMLVGDPHPLRQVDDATSHAVASSGQAVLQKGLTGSAKGIKTFVGWPTAGVCSWLLPCTAAACSSPLPNRVHQTHDHNQTCAARQSLACMLCMPYELLVQPVATPSYLQLLEANLQHWCYAPTPCQCTHDRDGAVSNSPVGPVQGTHAPAVPPASKV
jgi:hypothetical protein